MSILTGVIEVPRGSNHKYEIDSSGQLVLDRVLKRYYPTNYGYIPNTLSEDGDALDIFVYSSAPIHPLVKVKLEVLGVIEMVDNGVNDEKLICCLTDSLFQFDATFTEISYFLKNYKSGTVIKNIAGKERALEILAQARTRYEKT